MNRSDLMRAANKALQLTLRVARPQLSDPGNQDRADEEQSRAIGA